MKSDSTDQAPVHPAPPVALLRLVKILGVILVLMFLALIGGIIWKATHKAPVDAKEVVFDLGIDPTTIRLLAVDGNTLALTTDKELLVVDTAKRKVIMRSGKP